MELVSIIVPVYNVEKYLKKCVSSILNQSYKNIEIILVDDGSTDSSGKLCDKLKNEDTRITVLHKKNGGLSDARNYGLKYLKGSLIMFVDSDDYINPDMISIMYDKMNQDKSDMVICDFYKVGEFDELLSDENEKKIESNVVSNDELLDILCTGVGWRFVPAWNKLYKRKIWEDMSFPKGKLHEDEYVIHKIVEKCKKISLINNKLYYYVQRNGSIMNNITDRNRLDGTEALLDRTEFFLNLNKSKQARFCFESAVNKMLMDVKSENKKREYEILLEMKRIYKYNPFLIDNPNDKIKYIILQNGKIIYSGLCKLVNVRRKLFLKMKDNFIRRKYAQLKLNIAFKNIRKRKGKTAVLMSTPIHGNLGDQAIVYAEYGFLARCGIENIIEVDRYTYDNSRDSIKRLINRSDLIIICGGGNMGTLWPEEDNIIREIITSFKDNQIVVFPQTCYYDKTSESKRRLEYNYSAYKGCKKLTVALREEQSYAFFKKWFPDVNSLLVPDIVLSCDPKLKKTKRKNVLLCFRNDLEKQISSETLENIKSLLHKNSLAYSFTDTVVHKYIYKFNRKHILETKWNAFAATELVITDRLHGMIFATITKTPCIAVNNLNGKVEHVYAKWLNSFPEVICVEGSEITIDLINQMRNRKNCKKIDLSESFEMLRKIVICGNG